MTGRRESGAQQAGSSGGGRPRRLPAGVPAGLPAVAAAAAAVVLVLAAGGGGCGVDQGTLHPNQPPETVLTYAGPVDTVNSHVRLRWWGEDADGEILGYEYRWSFEGAAGPADWVFTAATTDSFALPAPSGRAAHLFEVRAVDDAAAVDPSPAAQLYPVRNTPPTIALRDAGSLPTVSLPAVTIGFEAHDADGDATVREAVGWLDGQDPATAGVRVPYPESFITFGPDDFDRYGARTIFLKAIDDGFAESAPSSYDIEIVEPVGDAILVDDMPDDIAGGTTQTDPFYVQVMDEVMGNVPYTLHKIENGPLRTPEEAAAIFSLFDVVVWYQGTNFVEGGNPVAVSTFSLRNASEAIRELLDRGGRMALFSMNAIGHQGAFDADFARQVLGVDPDSVLLGADAEDPEDTNFYLKTRYFPGQETWFLEGRNDGVYEDVRVIGSFWGLELYAAAPGAEVLYEVPAGVVTTEQPRLAVATRVRGAGSMVFCGFPLSRCSFEQRHRPVLRAILESELGLP